MPSSQALSDYQRIASAIDYLQTNSRQQDKYPQQPSLADIAAQVHLSEYHFQRLFSRWAGITPKRYLQLLTLERAKVLLKSQSALATSEELLLSSPSRLYDNFVNLIAVTPAEFASSGENLCFDYGYHPTPYGFAFIAQTERGICQLELLDNNEEWPLDALKKQWPKASFQENPKHTQPTIDIIFGGNTASNKPLSLWVKGTNFQVSVWRALLNIQPGDVSSYKSIASSIGKPKASRAVGTAIGSNPVALIIPCHRVLRQNGELGGYRWGETRKQAMLAREGALGE